MELEISSLASNYPNSIYMDIMSTLTDLHVGFICNLRVESVTIFMYSIMQMACDVCLLLLLICLFAISETFSSCLKFLILDNVGKISCWLFFRSLLLFFNKFCGKIPALIPEKSPTYNLPIWQPSSSALMLVGSSEGHLSSKNTATTTSPKHLL